MSKEIIGNVFKNLVGYFAIVFVGEFIIEKIYAPVGSIPWCFAFGNYSKMLILMILAYALYFLAASFIAENSTDGSGKFAVLVIVIFAILKMYWKINIEAAEMAKDVDLGFTLTYLLFAMPETLRIIATFHAMKQR